MTDQKVQIPRHQPGIFTVNKAMENAGAYFANKPTTSEPVWPASAAVSAALRELRARWKQHRGEDTERESRGRNEQELSVQRQSIATISVGFTKVAHTTSSSICRATKVKQRAGERSCLAAVQRRFLSRKSPDNTSGRSSRIGAGSILIASMIWLGIGRRAGVVRLKRQMRRRRRQWCASNAE